MNGDDYRLSGRGEIVNYFVKRDIQEYGPYSLAEMQRCVASGTFLPRDLCRREGSANWLLVEQLIGDAPPLGAVGAIPRSPYPLPPSLHWGIVVLLSVLTCGLFGSIWLIVQAIWVKKVQPSSTSVVTLCGSYALLLAAGVLGEFPEESLKTIGLIANLGGLVLSIFAIFSMRSSIEDHFNDAERVGLQLSGMMTFFFNVYYFQYHFTRIAESKRSQPLLPS